MPTRRAPDLLAVPEHRLAAIKSLLEPLVPGRMVVVSTHINADGDGCGSEAALVRLLAGAGLRPRIVNPTPWPTAFEFLLESDVDNASPEGVAAMHGVDVLVVVDIGDVRRLGVLTDAVRALSVPKLVIDHHLAGDEPPGPIILSDPTACATGELIFDIAITAKWPLTVPVAVALYTALLTDTGGFRFSNTSPRCHAIAGHLLSLGVDPEEMYRRIYASVPLGRVHLLRDALDTLEVDPELGVAWLSLPAGAVERYALRSEDLDGIVEHPRSISGTRLAIFFRDLGHGKVKVSFRSTGDVDVNRFARQFGGGGHARAAGALIPGTLERVREQVLSAARSYLTSPAPTAAPVSTPPKPRRR
jgi:phosphoesterase RecJ-like protein